jgi:dipeptidyl aminopeptidase/acylaminoacyl peptidase
MLADQIQAEGGQVELFTYRGDNHNISANFSRAMARSVRFFDTYVKGIDRD